MMKDSELVLKILEDQSEHSETPGFVLLGIVEKPHDGMFKLGYSLLGDPAFDMGSEDVNAANIPEIRLDLMTIKHAMEKVLTAKEIALVDYMAPCRPVVAIR